MRRFLRRAAALVGFASIASPIALGQGTAPKPFHKAAPAESIPLSRYIPASGLAGYIECDGFAASHGDAWRNSAPYKILNDTTTGVMLEDLLGQFLDRGKVNRASRPPGADASVPAFFKVASPDALTVIKHALNSGFVMAESYDPESKKVLDIEVFRNVTGKPVYEAFVRWTGASGSPSAKFGVLMKRGRKVVVVDDSKNPKPTRRWAWWFEKNNDLVRIDDEASIDLVLDLLEGKKPNASSNARVSGLAAAESGFQPVFRGFFDFEQFDAYVSSPDAPGWSRKWMDNSGIRRLDFRYGLDGAALMGIVRLESPSPRKAAMAVFDQPTFTARTIPPIPSSATSFWVGSIDLAKLYGSGVEKVKAQADFDSSEMGKFDRKFHEATKLRFKEDVLTKFGPKYALYQLPTKVGRGLKIGIQVPKLALMIESPDMEGMGRVVDQFVFFVNKKFKEMAAPPPEDPKDKPPSGRPRGDSDTPKKKKAPPAAEFSMTTPTPRTYLLKLPPSLAALTNASVTITLGKRHLIIATDPGAAHEANKLEGQTEGRWKAEPELAGALDRLPTGLIYLSVGDPRESLPQALATIPMTLQSLLDLAPLATSAVPMAMPIPSAPPGAAPTPANPNAPPEGMQRFGQGIMNIPKGGTMGSGGQPSEGAPPANNPPPGPPPGMPATAMVALPPIRVDPAKLPDPEAIKPHLFPGLLAVSVDAQGLKLTSRGAFPDVSLLSAIMNSPIRSMIPGLPPAMPPAGLPSGTPPPQAGPGIANRPGARGASGPKSVSPMISSPNSSGGAAGKAGSTAEPR